VCCGCQVKLEFCVAHDVDMSLSGTVRVINVSFHKSVFIRYTLNRWKSTERDVSLTLLWSSLRYSLPRLVGSTLDKNNRESTKLPSRFLLTVYVKTNDNEWDSNDQLLFGPLGMHAERAICFADFFSLFLVVDLWATSSQELRDGSSPNFQSWYSYASA